MTVGVAAVDVVVVSFNCREALLACCESVVESAPADAIEPADRSAASDPGPPVAASEQADPGAGRPEARLIVVDNASDDGSAEAVRRRFPAATVIERSRNDGFATAVNAGVRAGGAELVLLLNPDARLCDDALETLAGVLGGDPAAGAAGPRIVSRHGALELSRGRTLAPLNEAAFKLAGRLYREGRGPLAPWIGRRYARR